MIERIELFTSLCAAAALLLGLSACAQKHSHMPPGDYMSQQSTGQMVRQLDAAKELDESEATRSSTGSSGSRGFPRAGRVRLIGQLKS